jgi:hypothetical protein
MSFRNEHVLFILVLYEYFDIVHKRLLTKEQMSMQKVKMEKKIFLQLTCENNCDE